MDIELFGPIIVIVLFIVCSIGWKVFDDLNKLYQIQNIYKKVGWIAEKEKSTVAYKDASLRSEDLIYYIMQYQRKLDTPKQYCIDFTSRSEVKNIEEILDYHKNKTVERYFHGFLSKSRKICKLTPLEYYFYSLYCFLYEEIEGAYSSSFKWCSNDNGISYFKLYLIANIFVENNENTKKLFDYINPNFKKITMEHIEKINSHLEERRKLCY